MRFLGILAAIWLGAAANSVSAASVPEMLAMTAPAPVLDLQFQTGVLDSRITFARASSGNYFSAAGLLLTATTNAPRFGTFGPGGGQIGWLLEGAATNLVLWNRDLTNAVWVKLLGTAALDQVGIDGISNSASSFTATSANATVLQTVTLSSAARTFNVFFKRLVGAGVVSLTQDGTTYSPVTLTSAWQAFPLTATQLNPVVGFKLATSGDSVAFDYSGLETGTFATSPIFTTTTTVTRAAETASMSSAGIIKGQAPFTLFVSAAAYAAVSSANQVFAVVDNGAATNRVQLFRALTTGLLSSTVVATGGTNWIINDSVAMPVGSAIATTAAITQGSFQSAFAGRLPAASTATGTPIVPVGITTIRFGTNNAGAAGMFGFLYRFAIRPYAQPVAVLAHSSFAGMP